MSRRQGAGAARRTFRARAPAAVPLLALAALFAAAIPAQAQTTFVSNIGQADRTDQSNVGTREWRAQQFETGDADGGYTLSEVVVNIRTATTGTPTFALYTSNASDFPGTKIVDLTGSVGASGEQSFTPDSTTVLTGSTKYFIFFSMSSGTVSLQSTNSDNIDAGATSGWDIAEVMRFSSNGGGSWNTHPASVEIAVKGTVVAGTLDDAAIWSATVVAPASEIDDTFVAYCAGACTGLSTSGIGSLTDSSFEYPGGTTYNINAIWAQAGGDLLLEFDTEMPQDDWDDLTLHVGTDTLALSDAKVHTGSNYATVISDSPSDVSGNEDRFAWVIGNSNTVLATDTPVFVQLVSSAPSTDATLSDLELEDASDESAITTFNPAFTSDATIPYAAWVVNSETQITVKPTGNDDGATFKYLNASDSEITDANTSKDGHQVALIPGANTIQVEVTAEDDVTTAIYKLVVTRALATDPNENAIWSATLTPLVSTIDDEYLGYCGSACAELSSSGLGSLTETSFEHPGGTTYNINATWARGRFRGTDADLFLEFDTEMPEDDWDDLTLHVGTETFALSEAKVHTGNYSSPIQSGASTVSGNEDRFAWEGGNTNEIMATDTAVFVQLVSSATTVSGGDDAFVSNLGKDDRSDGVVVAASSPRAQQFETGANAGGYTLSEVVVDVKDASTSSPRFDLYTSTSGDEPGNWIVDLSGNVDTAGEQSFTPDDPVILAPSTKYYVVFETNTSTGIELQTTDSNDVDDDSHGWDIRDTSATANAADTWTSIDDAYAIKIAVKGTAESLDPKAIWSATLTPEAAPLNGEYLAYCGGACAGLSTSGTGSLTDTSFEYPGGTTYNIDAIWSLLDGDLYLEFDKAMPEDDWDDLTLHVGAATFLLSNARVHTGVYDSEVSGSALLVSGDEDRFAWRNGNSSPEVLATGTAVIVQLVSTETVISTDATLSDLEVENASDDSAIALNPAFFGATSTPYAAWVANGETQVTVEPTANDDGATIKYLNADNSEIDDANTSKDGHQVVLSEGANTVQVIVTAEDTVTTETSTLVVTRALGTAAHANAIWSATLTPLAHEFSYLFGYCRTACGELSETGRGSLTDTDFVLDGTTYNINAVAIGGGGDFELEFDTAMPEADWADLTLHVGTEELVLSEARNGPGDFNNFDASDPLVSGNENQFSWLNANSPSIVATGTAIFVQLVSTETVTSTDATLSDLELEDASDDSAITTFNPAFTSDATIPYAAWVANGVTQITVKPTGNDDGATFEYLDGDDSEIDDANTTKDGRQVALSEGANIIQVKVTAEDDVTTETYKLVVTRALATAPEANAVWSATLTVLSNSDDTDFGFCESACTGLTSSGLGSLTDSDFEYPSGSTYNINAIWGERDGDLFLEFAAEMPQDDWDELTLHVGTETFALSNARVHTGDYTTHVSGSAPHVSGNEDRFAWFEGNASPQVLATDTAVFVQLVASADPNATGGPVIDGTPQVGQTLTATIGDIADEDGLPGTFPAGYDFQWVRLSGGTENDITGATSDTYMPMADDVGNTLHVEVTFTDGGGTEEFLTSVSTATVVAKQEDCATDRPNSNWCTTMTVGVARGVLTTYGYSGGALLGALDDATIEYGGTTFTVGVLQIQDGPGEAISQNFVTVGLNVAGTGTYVPTGTVFDFGGTAFTADDDSEHTTVGQHRWAIPAGFAWLKGQKVTVSANLAPGVVGATANGTSLVITFTEDLAAAANLANSAFAVKKTPDSGTEETVSLSGSISPSISGTTVTLTLAAAGAVSPSDTDVKVSYTKPSTDDDNRLEDASGLEVNSFTDQAVTNNTAGNVDATGAPAITDTAQAGKTLTANTSGIMDDNGLNNVDYTYQWTRVNLDGHSNETDVGTDSSTYALTSADVGKRLVVEVTFDDDASNSESLTSATSTVVAPAADLSVCPGGETGVWCATLTSESFVDSGNDRAGFIAANNLGDVDPPRFDFNGVTYEVTRLHGGGRSVGFAIATTPDLPSTNGLKLHLQTFGSEHSGNLGPTRTVSGIVEWTFSYPSGYHNGPLSHVPLLRGATEPGAFFPEPTDDGTEIAVRLSRPANDAATGKPAITGTAAVGQTLTADVSGIVDGNGRTNADSGEPGFAYNYRWLRYDADGSSNEVEVQDGASNTYTAAANDSGKTIRVEVTYSDDNGYSEERTSDASAVIEQVSGPVFEEGSSTTRTLQETLADATEATARDVGNPVTANDPEMETLTYGLEGADEAKFTIDPSNGQIRTKAGETYDHEADSSLAVRVTVTNGSLSAGIAVTIGIEDRNEPPIAPGAPTVTATEGSSTSLEVAWEAPSNTGRPAITAYGLSYRVSGAGPWSEGPQGITDTSATLTGLSVDTAYHVRVRAVNDEGDGDYSDYGTGRTNVPEVRFERAAYSAVEGTAGVTVTVLLGAPATRQVRVPLSVTHQGGATTADYSDVPDSVTFAVGDTSKSFTVTATDDPEEDDGESILIEFDGLPGGIRAGTPAATTVSLVATEVTVWYLSFEHRSYTATEGGAGARVSARLNAPWKPDLGESLTVSLEATLHGGAVEDDYSGVPGSLTFGPGQTEASFTVTATDDTDDDDGESLVLQYRFSGIEDLEVSPNAPWQTTVHLHDNDGVKPVSVSFDALSYEATERGSPATVTVRLSEAPGRALSIPLTHRGRNHATSHDYEGVPASLAFGANDTEKSFDVRAINDGDNDDLEYVEIGFGDLPSRVSAGSPSSTTVNLKDNDGGRKNVVLRFDTGETTTLAEGRSTVVHVYADDDSVYNLSIPIRVEHIGGATPDDYAGVPTSVTLDRTTNFGEDRFGTFNFSVREDSEGGEEGEGVRLSFGTLPAGVSAREGRSARKVLFLDNDGFPAVSATGGSVTESANPQSYLTFNVRLDHAAEYEVKVDYATADGSAIERQDYEPESGTLTFDPGQTSKSVRVKVCADGIPEGAENFRLQLSNPVRALIKGGGRATGRIRAIAGGLLGGGAGAAPCSTGAWVEDGEASEPHSPGLIGRPIPGLEHLPVPGRVAFGVRLNEPAPGRVTVDYSTFDRTAIAGQDYTAVSGTVTFEKGESSKTVGVTLLHDDHDDAGETFGLRLSNARGAYIGRPTATGTIRNSGLMPGAWLSRFGRAATDNALEAIGRRIQGDGERTRETHVTVGGRRLDALFAQGAQALRDGTVLGGTVFDGDGREGAAREGSARQGSARKGAARQGGDGGDGAPSDRRAELLRDETTWERMDRMNAEMLDGALGVTRVGERAPAGVGQRGGAMPPGGSTLSEGTLRSGGTAPSGGTMPSGGGRLSGAAAGGMAAAGGRSGRRAGARVGGTMRRADGSTDWGGVLDTVAQAAGDARWAQWYRSGTRMLRQGERLVGEAERFDLRDAMMDSSFHYARPGDPDAEPGGWLGDWAVWGETAATRFKGAEEGLAVDGQVATALVGFDSRRERWLAGVAISYSEGTGTYRRERVQGGTVTSRMTNLHPYARFDLSERTQLWATLGYGAGDLSLTPARAEAPIETGLSNMLAAFGGRTELVARSGAAGRFELAVRSDARYTRTTSDTAVNLLGATGATGRVRVLLEGSGSMPLSTGGVLSPTLEAGLRYDMGDAETGTGLEIGTGLGYAAGALSVQVNARALVAHEDTEYEEWGLGGSVSYRPGQDGKGLSLELGSKWGDTQSGVRSLWSQAEAGLAPGGAAMDAAQRFTAELGYGFEGAKRGALWAPFMAAEAGEKRQSLRLGVKLNSGPNVEAALELGQLRQLAREPENAVQLKGAIRF